MSGVLTKPIYDQLNTRAMQYPTVSLKHYSLLELCLKWIYVCCYSFSSHYQEMTDMNSCYANLPEMKPTLPHLSIFRSERLKPLFLFFQFCVSEGTRIFIADLRWKRARMFDSGLLSRFGRTEKHRAISRRLW